MDKRIIKIILKSIPGIEAILNSNENLKSELKKYKTFYPPGHFYSSVHSLEDLDNYTSLENSLSSKPLGIDLNHEQQANWLNQFIKNSNKVNFPASQTEDYRYYYENDYYGYNDGIICQSLVNELKPKRIIEVGSGFSSALMLDLNERFFQNSIDLHFVEPYPERLQSLLKKDEKVNLYVNTLQKVDIKLFELLEENDILFIDSTHVSKFSSDVNWLFFEILPRLKRGVYIHIHDIFWCFEYPFDWLRQGRSWNEAYLLRAFLQYNQHFNIQYFNSYAEEFFKSRYEIDFSIALKSKGGSIWLKKVL